MISGSVGTRERPGKPGMPLGERTPTPTRMKVTVAGLLLLGVFLAAGIVYLTNVLTNPRMTLIPAPVAKEGQAEIPAYRFSIYGRQELPLHRPLAVGESPDGSIYIADTGNGLIQVFDHNGRFKGTIGKPGGEEAKEGELSFPVGLAFDEKSNVFVTDSRSGHISVFSPKGEFLGYFGETESSKAVVAPTGIAYKNNRFYVTDLDSHKIAVLDYKGDKVYEIGAGRGDGEGQLQYPNYVWVGAEGEVFVSDSNNNRVQVFGPGGEVTRVIRGDEANATLNLPRGISIDEHGNIHVVSVFNHKVKVFDSEGNIVYTYGDRGERDGELNFPNGLFIAGKRIYITDRENNRVQVWEY